MQARIFQVEWFCTMVLDVQELKSEHLQKCACHFYIEYSQKSFLSSYIYLWIKHMTVWFLTHEVFSPQHVQNSAWTGWFCEELCTAPASAEFLGPPEDFIKWCQRVIQDILQSRLA